MSPLIEQTASPTQKKQPLNPAGYINPIKRVQYVLLNFDSKSEINT